MIPLDLVALDEIEKLMFLDSRVEWRIKLI
jgi:hypothetical protein